MSTPSMQKPSMQTVTVESFPSIHGCQFRLTGLKGSNSSLTLSETELKMLVNFHEKGIFESLVSGKTTVKVTVKLPLSPVKLPLSPPKVKYHKKKPVESKTYVYDSSSDSSSDDSDDDSDEEVLHPCLTPLLSQKMTPFRQALKQSSSKPPVYALIFPLTDQSNLV